MKSKTIVILMAFYCLYISFASNNVQAQVYIGQEDSVIVHKCGYILYYDLNWAWFVPLKDSLQEFCNINNFLAENLDVGMDLQAPWKDFYWKNETLKSKEFYFSQKKVISRKMDERFYYLTVLPVCIKYMPDKLSNQYRYENEKEIQQFPVCIQNKKVLIRMEFLYHRLVDIQVCEPER